MRKELKTILGEPIHDLWDGRGAYCFVAFSNATLPYLRIELNRSPEVNDAGIPLGIYVAIIDEHAFESVQINGTSSLSPAGSEIFAQ